MLKTEYLLTIVWLHSLQTVGLDRQRLNNSNEKENKLSQAKGGGAQWKWGKQLHLLFSLERNICAGPFIEGAQQSYYNILNTHNHLPR
jgi:hypothetical protein